MNSKYRQQHKTATQNNLRKTNDLIKFDNLIKKNVILDRVIPNLIFRLCKALDSHRIAYCHWKSNNAIDRSLTGENDLDLLVSRADVQQFIEILYRLGFKEAKAKGKARIPSVLDYYGYDEETERFVHVHAHFHLIIGHDMTKNYWLPIEKEYIESSVQDDLLKVPACEFEFIVFVIRMVLKHSTWDVILFGDKILKPAEQQEFDFLKGRINQNRVKYILKQHLKFIGTELFNRCIYALSPDCSKWRRIKVGNQLQVRLKANARNSMFVDISLKLLRRVIKKFRKIIFNYSSKYCLESGGIMIAIVGGDGAGKTTAVDGVYNWLSKYFETTRIHMGKPAWSYTTIAIRGILKVGNLLGLYPAVSSFENTLKQDSFVSPGYPWLLREICKARDRYWTYFKARRYAAKGGVVILDRYPLPQIRLMDGPQTERFINRLSKGTSVKGLISPSPSSRLSEILVKLEESYYQKIVAPELLIVLRVEPKIAVQRRFDEDANFVRERSKEVWELNWGNTDCFLIDGSKSTSEVLMEIKSLIWSKL